MKKPRITMSRLDLVAQCPGSGALPWVESQGQAALDGIAGHEWLRRALLGHAPEPPPRMADRLNSIDLAALRTLVGPHPRCEESYWYDPATDTACPCGTNIGRNYPTDRADLLYGTADVVSNSGAYDIITDWKFGHWVPDAADSWQIKALCLAVVRAYGAASVTGQIVRITDEGGHFVTHVDFEPMDLDGIAADLRTLLAKVADARQVVAAGGEPELREGPLCVYCPAFANCPQQARLAQALVPMVDRLAALTPESAGEMWAKVRAVEGVVRKVKDALSTYLDMVGELPMENGKVLRRIQAERRHLSALVAVEVLRERGLLAQASPHIEVTQAALERAVGKGVVKSVVADIEARGGARTATYTTTKECKR